MQNFNILDYFASFLNVSDFFLEFSRFFALYSTHVSIFFLQVPNFEAVQMPHSSTSTNVLGNYKPWPSLTIQDTSTLMLNCATVVTSCAMNYEIRPQISWSQWAQSSSQLHCLTFGPLLDHNKCTIFSCSDRNNIDRYSHMNFPESGLGPVLGNWRIEGHSPWAM
jgi:hypothetical protein